MIRYILTDRLRGRLNGRESFFLKSPCHSHLSNSIARAYFILIPLSTLMTSNTSISYKLSNPFNCILTKLKSTRLSAQHVFWFTIPGSCFSCAYVEIWSPREVWRAPKTLEQLPRCFLCFAPFVFLGSIVLTSLFSLFYVTRDCKRFLHRGWAASSHFTPLLFRQTHADAWTNC